MTLARRWFATLVLMADGTTKPIAGVRVGEMVMATDPETGERGPLPRP